MKAILLFAKGVEVFESKFEVKHVRFMKKKN